MRFYILAALMLSMLVISCGGAGSGSSAISDEEAQVMVDDAAEAVTIQDILGSANTSYDSITDNLVLPRTGDNGIEIAWESSDPDVISSDGVVTRPSYTEGDKDVVLTATFSLDTADALASRSIWYVTKDYVFRVKARDINDAESVAAALTDLTFDTIKNSNTAQSSITSDLTLPDSGSQSTAISWASSDSAVISADGAVTRPAYGSGGASVTLTATVSKGAVSAGKTFTLTVPETPATDADKVAEAKTALTFDTIKDLNSAEGKIRYDLSLPAAGENSASITWSSSDTNFITDAGVVTRPDSGSGDQNVDLVATISLNSESDTKTFSLNLPYTNKFIDGDTAFGITPSANDEYTRMPIMTDFNGTLYSILYKDGGTRLMRFMKYSGDDLNPSWTFLDGAGADDSINKDSSQDAWYPDLAVLNGVLYAVWEEYGTSAWQVRAAKYSGDDSSPSWTFIDGNGADGLNYDTSDGGLYPKAAAFNGRLYAIWRENAAVSQIRVKEYNGTSWSFVDGGTANGINYSPALNADNPDLIVYNSSLYAVWNESNGAQTQIRAARYSGTPGTWVFVDGGAASGLNKDSTKSASMPKAAVYDGKLYVTWRETDGTADQIRVSAYDGSTWTRADGGASTGINIDTTKNGDTPQIAEAGSKLYIGWLEYNGAAVNQMRLKSFDGTNWTAEDGGGATGLNKDVSKSASEPSMYGWDSTLYIMFEEDNGTQYQVRAKAW